MIYAPQLSLFLRTAIVQEAHLPVSHFGMMVGINRDVMEEMMHGEWTFPGETSRRDFNDILNGFSHLRRGIQRLDAGKIRAFDALVRQAYLEKMGWLDKKAWFEEKQTLQEFFEEGKRQMLLSYSGSAFTPFEKLPPRLRIVWRFVDWWMSHNHGRYSVDLKKAALRVPLIALGAKSMRDLVYSGKPPADFKMMQAFALKVSKPEMMEEWFAWRLEEEKGAFRREGHDKRAEKIYFMVLGKWVRINGGYFTNDFQRHTQEYFGVSRTVILNLRRGRVTTNRKVLERLISHCRRST